MTLKLTQIQIFFGVISLTLGIILGSIGVGYFMGQSDTSTILSATNPNPTPAPVPNLEQTAINQALISIPSPLTETKSSATTTVSLEIGEAAPEIIKTDLGNPPQDLALTKTQTLKNLKITVDNIEYTSVTPFRDPNSQIRDDETFVLLNVTLENISSKTLDLDGRAYLIQIFQEQVQNSDGKAEAKQIVYKPARELGPTFSQSRSTLIRKNFKPNQKFSGLVGFKIPKNTNILNFYYPDVLGSTEIALFKLK